MFNEPGTGEKHAASTCRKLPLPLRRVDHVSRETPCIIQCVEGVKRRGYWSCMGDLGWVPRWGHHQATTSHVTLLPPLLSLSLELPSEPLYLLPKEKAFFFFLKKRLQLEMSIHKRIEWELLVFAQSICFLSIPGCLFEKLPCRVSASVRIWKEEDWDARALLVSSRIICVHGKCRNPMQSLLFSVGLFDVPEIDGLCCWLNVDRISFSTLHSHNLVSRFPF